MPRKQTVHGKPIVRKSTHVRYFSQHRICLEYRPLSRPKHEYVAWFIGDDGKEAGYDVTKKVYDGLRVPETVHNSASDRLEWERLQKRRQPSYSGFVRP